MKSARQEQARTVFYRRWFKPGVLVIWEMRGEEWWKQAKKEGFVAAVLLVAISISASWHWGVVLALAWTLMQATLRYYVVECESQGHPLTYYSELGTHHRAGRRLAPNLPSILWTCPSCRGKSRVPHPRCVPKGKMIQKVTCPHCGEEHPYQAGL